MRRAPIVITSTVAGMVAVLTFKPHAPELSSSVAVATVVPQTTPTPASPATSGAEATTPESSPKQDSGGGSGSSAASGTATGIAVDTRYGPAQVRVTVAQSQITKIEAVQLQHDDPKSVEISNYAAPLLAQSALSKQSGAIDHVSGATFTSVSYEASLQSALDKLGFQATDGSRGSTDTSVLDQIQGEGHGGGPGGPPPGGFR